MPLVLKTLKTFLPAKTRNRDYCIHTSIPPCPPDTHTPLRHACGSSGSRAAPPPRPSCQYPPTPTLPPTPPPSAPTPPPGKFWQIGGGGGVASGLVVVAPSGLLLLCCGFVVVPIVCAFVCLCVCVRMCAGQTMKPGGWADPADLRGCKAACCALCWPVFMFRRRGGDNTRTIFLVLLPSSPLLPLVCSNKYAGNTAR